MLTAREVRRLALSLPDTEEHRDGGRPSFRVGGTTFAWLVPRRGCAGLKLSPDEQNVLRRVQPDVFRVHRVRGSDRWTWVELSRVHPWVFEELLVEAWRRHASRRAIGRWNAGRRQ